jgi:hypothetical protein
VPRHGRRARRRDAPQRRVPERGRRLMGVEGRGVVVVARLLILLKQLS